MAAGFNRHKSKQDYQTPANFRYAVVQRFGFPDVDLACTESNKFGDLAITKKEDSLSLDWNNFTGICWLNPPFKNINLWAKKCAESTCRILFLVPASIGSRWFSDYVYNKSLILGLTGRLSFDGINPFPKDLILCCYNFPSKTGFWKGFELWDWRK